MTLEDLETKVRSQNGVCEICNKDLDMSRLTHIDHCHKTGSVRGVLCSTCNRGIGYLQDDVAVVSAALDYLRRYQSD
ncbi:recombination endonuclease VII [Pseudomonas phage vB_PseuGesM_254]|uniref:Recombination endonuclease VII n=1 Tax=Pseudomonas phage vB_PseuGesM_254 TaxID=3092638 RepID=A0AAX4G6I0_9CAUD|nr:recombination endonuclease VII [Pseudomonas phage PseuGes_254]